jgi:hypothetical protein
VIDVDVPGARAPAPSAVRVDLRLLATVLRGIRG